jgi:microcin C transport system ATP-binding protein
VLKDGRVVAAGEAERLTAAPEQPYTRALMAAAFDLRAEPIMEQVGVERA